MYSVQCHYLQCCPKRKWVVDKGPHSSHFPVASSPTPTSVPISPTLPTPGEPDLKVPTNVTVGVGETLKLPCNLPCKFVSYEKFWCKWNSKSCKALPSQDEGSGQASVNCNQDNQLLSLTLNSVTKEDEGWYWCGVKKDLQFRETVAVYVEVKERVKGESLRARPTSPQTPEKKAPA